MDQYRDVGSLYVESGGIRTWHEQKRNWGERLVSLTMLANVSLYIVFVGLQNGILTYGPVGPGLWRPACGRSAFALAGSPRVLVGVVPGFSVTRSTVATMLAQGALYRSFSC